MKILKTFKNSLIETLKDNKKLIIILYVLFIITFIISWLISAPKMASFVQNLNIPSTPTNSNNSIRALELFTNNELGGITTYIYSIFFGIMAIVMLIYNAANLGTIGALFNATRPNGGLEYIIYLIPHGIFEITATVLESVAGILLFLFIWRFLKTIIKSDENGLKVKAKKSFEINKKILIQSIILMIFTTILLLIAAPIEAYISIPFSELIMGA